MTDQLADLFTPAPEESGELYNERLGATQLAGEVETLRRALVDCLAHVEAGTIPTGNRIRAWRELAGTEYVDGLEPFERGMEGSARAAAKWTDEEVAKVDEVIKGLAEGRYYPTPPDGIEFTTADVWAILGDGFPVTKGIAGRMTSAKGAGLIESTGRTTYPPVNAPGPNNGQRLTVWRSLVGKV
jgi:hypothetical protein